MQGVELTIVHYENILPATTLLAGIAYFYTMCNRVKMVKSEKMAQTWIRTGHLPLNRERSYHCAASFFVLSFLDIYLIV